jgi:hypothetical protein
MHKLIIKEYHRITKEIYKEWEEKFYSYHNAERRKRELEWINSDTGSAKRVKAILIRNPKQKEIIFKPDY